MGEWWIDDSKLLPISDDVLRDAYCPITNAPCDGFMCMFAGIRLSDDGTAYYPECGIAALIKTKLDKRLKKDGLTWESPH